MNLGKPIIQFIKQEDGSYLLAFEFYHYTSVSKTMPKLGFDGGVELSLETKQVFDGYQFTNGVIASIYQDKNIN